MLHSNDENSMSDNSGKWITLVSERTDFTVHQMIVWRRWFTQKGYIHILILAMFIDKSYGSREEWLALHPWFLQMPKKKVKKKDKKKTDKRITVYAIVIATRNFVVLTRNFCNMYRSIKWYICTLYIYAYDYPWTLSTTVSRHCLF